MHTTHARKTRIQHTHARHAYNTRTQDTHIVYARKACIQHTHARHAFNFHTHARHAYNITYGTLSCSYVCLSVYAKPGQLIPTTLTKGRPPEPCICTIHLVISLPKTLHSPYIYMVLANPTHMVLINLTRTMSRPACACNTRACAYTQMHIRLHSYICLHQVAFILCVYVCVCVCVFHRPV